MIHGLCFVCCDSIIEKSPLNFIYGNTCLEKYKDFIVFL